MRVLHLGKYFSPVKGGMERFLEDVVLAQRRAGQPAFALVHQTNKAGNDVVADPDWLRRVPVAMNVSFAPVAPKFLAELNRAIDDWRPDYLHLHLPNLSAMAALVSSNARKLPWVIHWHSDVVSSEHSLALRLLYPFYRPFECALLEHAALVVCTSHPYLETSEPLQLYREKCVVVPLGLDLDRMRDAGTDHSVAWGVGSFRLLAVGRLTYYNGFDTLIKAVALCPQVELRIVGEGADRPVLTALIAALGVSDRVFLEGELSDAQCACRYRTAELFCIPSRERTEAFGLVVLEAMAHRLPVLASELPGSGLMTLVTVFSKEPSGRLAAVDNPAAWRDAILAFRADRDASRRMGEAGLKRLHQSFTIDDVQATLRTAIDATLAPDAPRPEAHARPLVVIPAKNEATTIALVVQNVLNEGFADVLVVDDASDDDTGRVARAAGAVVLAAPLPQGAWGAMQTGIRYGVRHNFTSVITLDADGQHRPEEIDRLLQAARFADVVIGACPSRGSRARKFAWIFFRRLTGFSLEDLTSGFRLYNARACKLLAFTNSATITGGTTGVAFDLVAATGGFTNGGAITGTNRASPGANPASRRRRPRCRDPLRGSTC